jgi:hypothetical protein
MPTPEQLLANAAIRFSKMNPKGPQYPDASKHKESWVRDLLGRLARAVRNIGGKR